MQIVTEYRQRVDALIETGWRLVRHRLGLARERLARCTAQLRALDPEATLARGYAIVQRQDTGRPVTKVSHVQPGDAVAVRVSDGTFDTVVRHVRD